MNRLYRVLPAASLLWVAACNSPFSEPSESGPSTSTSSTLTGAFDPLPHGFDWEMAERFPVDGDGDGVRDEREDSVYLDPKSFQVTLDGCPAADPGHTYQWLIKGERFTGDTWQVSYPDRGCRFASSFPGQGMYEVTLTVRASSGDSRAYVQKVAVKDWLVVVMGDSYGSGEGAPDVPRQNGQPARWANQRCHRSFKAGAALAARQLEEQDRRTSVTYLSLACSGATIGRVTRDQGDFDTFNDADTSKSIQGSGLLGPYIGIEPVDGGEHGPWNDFLPSQVDRLQELVPSRRIDALVISAGGNDMGFGDVLKHCAVSNSCHKEWDGRHLRGGVDRLYDALPGHYEELGDRIQSQLNVAQVYLTEYPDFSHDANGDTCEVILDGIMPVFTDGILRSTGEIGWIQRNFLPPLLQRMRDAVQTQRDLNRPWHFVEGMQAASQTHGLCAGNSRWFRTPAESVSIQGPDDKGKTKGTAHPNEEGYAAYSRVIRASFAKTLSAHPYYPDGTVLREPISGDIHVIQGYGRFYVPNEPALDKLLASLHKTRSDIVGISAARLADIPKTPRDSTFIREDNGSISLVHGGAAFGVPNPEELTRLQGELGVTDADVGDVPDGATGSLRPVPREGTVLRDAASGAIAYTFRSTRKGVANMTQLYELGILGGQVNPVPWGTFSSDPAAPVGANAPLALSPLDGTFWREPSTGTIAIVYGGAAFNIPNEAERDDLLAHAGRADPLVHDLPVGALASLPRLPRDGQLLRTPDGSIRIVHGGKAFGIGSMEELNLLLPELPWEQRVVKNVPSTAFDQLRTVPLDRTLLRERNDPRVFVILGATKHHVQSEAEARALGLDLDRVGVVPVGAL